MKQPLPTLILLDTSFILTMLRNHMELEEEIRRFVPGPVKIATTDGVIMELQRISTKGSHIPAGLAKLALSSLENGKVATIDSSPAIPDVDTSILSTALADRGRVIVGTVDGGLKRLLVKHSLGMVSPRKRKGLLVSLGARVPLK